MGTFLLGKGLLHNPESMRLAWNLTPPKTYKVSHLFSLPNGVIVLLLMLTVVTVIKKAEFNIFQFKHYIEKEAN